MTAVPRRHPRHRRHAVAREFCAAALGLAWLACEERPVDADPAGAARAFVERIQRVHGEPASAQAAYTLIDAASRKNLEERARRASALAGRTVAPEEMLAPSWAHLQFKPQRYQAIVEGERARVMAFGRDPTERREILMAREGNRWRVFLELPPLPPVKERPPAPPVR